MAKMLDTSPNWTQTKPTTRVSTRQLGFFLVEVNNVENDPYEADSLYSRAVRGIMTQTEMFAVGEPYDGSFMVVVASDTGNDGSNTENAELGDNYNDMAWQLQTAVSNSIQDSCSVYRKHLRGSGFASGLTLYSDESQNDD